MGLMLQVTWQLMNLFIIAVAVLVPGSSGSIVQPPILSPSSNSPPVHQIIQRPPTFLSPRQSTTLPTQNNFATFSTTPRPHGSAPSSSVEPPNYSAFPAAKAPQDSTLPPVAKLSHDLAPPLPAAEPSHYSTAPPSAEPSHNSTMTPSTEPPHASAVSPAAKPPVARPQPPTAESPETLPLASSSPPPEDAAESPQIPTPNTVLAPSHASLQPVVAKPPHSSALPLAANPPYPKPPLPVAETPQASFVPPAAKPPVSIPQLPIAESPKDLPLASPLSPPKVSQHTSGMLSPPVPVAESPVNLSPPTVLAPFHASPQPPGAKPPYSSALPLAAEPPDPNPPLPVADPPRASVSKPTVVIPQLPTAKPPEASPLESPSPPLQVSQHNSTMQSPPIPAAEPPGISTPPNVLAPLHASPQPPAPKPPHSSALPLAANPPDPEPPLPVAEPPQGLNLTPPAEASPSLPLLPPAMAPQPSDKQSPPGPLNASSPPPQIGPPKASSPLPQPVPPYQSSPPPQLAPPYTLPPPPQPAPPYTLPPPPQLILPHPPPPTSTVPSNASLLPPSMTPPSPEPPTTLPSPFPPLPPVVSPPLPQLIPPIVSFPPPLLISPPVSPPDSVLPPPTNLPSPSPPQPPIVSPPSPQSQPPIVSPPSPQLMPPIVSPPSPQLMPPIVSSPPSLLIPPPASPPNSVLPSNASVPSPLILPPPDLPSPFPAAPPRASAMLSPPTSHASSPQPQLVPPHSSSPPFVLSAPPPLELPHISPPRSSIVSGTIPLHASPPSPFLNPPLAPVSPAFPSRPFSAPPPSKPSHSSVPPSPVKQQTVPAAPPLSSHRNETQEGAPPPSLTSPEQSPSSSTMPEGAPPAHLVTPRSLPPSSKQTEAPKHAPFFRSNASEPDISPSSTPPPSNNPSRGRYSSMAPPGRAPEQSPEYKLSPRHAPSEPEFERHNATAPAPFSFGVHPAQNGSHHSLRHSPVKGSPTVMAPLSSPPEMDEITPAPSPLQKASPGLSGIPFLSPKISPSGSSTRKTKRRLAPPIRSLPPPPPNADCAYLTCPEPFTNTPPGSPCGCVWPMQVGLRLSVALYTFFPLVSELAREIAAGVFMKQSQVRVMGANAASQESDKTIVLVDLVPLDEKFDNITAFLTYHRFWHKQVAIDKSIFGDYDVLYVRYPGLPASPPMAPADIAVINGMPYSVRDPNQSKVHPLGVDVTKQRHRHRFSGIVIAAIVFSAIVCVLICCSVAWFLVFRHTNHEPQPAQTPRALPSLARSSVPTGNSTGSGPSSLLSIGSSLATYNGSAKTFSASEMEKATDNFSPSRIVGEGGFGLVYSGVLEDKTSVAVKVLKRDDQQGGREFLAEVEMLSRLHHRNLVKLIGICTDERLRCLVYELIPNGSVESHLHGPDKEPAPLDWASRMKIALGAARGLAYLHEDSSPRVIHRDFKSSNILLENDFTPKVSDFGLARSAMDENNQHISTRVMGTFGYVAPEYAMTGHLLVKSDVYSYGVVLLELLTGRKPVDMSQPPGQENLATWTRPFLTTKEGLELILDPSLGSDIPLDSAAKVAAIASMCVQSEVSHRPFMGEVVQALKLVCDECDDSKDGYSRHGSHENLSADFDDKASPISATQDYLPAQFSLPNYHTTFDVEKGLSVSENFSASVMTNGQTSDSYIRRSASGPLKTVKGRHFWQRIRRSSNGSVSEHGAMYRLWAGSH